MFSKRLSFSVWAVVMSSGNRVSFNYCFHFVELPMFDSRLVHTDSIVD